MSARSMPTRSSSKHLYSLSSGLRAIQKHLTPRQSRWSWLSEPGKSPLSFSLLCIAFSHCISIHPSRTHASVLPLAHPHLQTSCLVNQHRTALHMFSISPCICFLFAIVIYLHPFPSNSRTHIMCNVLDF